MITYGRIVLFAVGVGTLAGCSGSTDPRQAGILDVVRNSADGSYKNRLDAGEKRNASAARSNAALRASNADLTRQHDDLVQEVSAARKRISAMEKKIARAKNGLAATDARYLQLANSERRLDGARDQLNAAGKSNDQDALFVALRRIALTEEELKL